MGKYANRVLGRSANIVAIPLVACLGCVVWSHGCITAHATHKTLEQRTKLISNRNATGFAVVLEQFLDSIPQIYRNDRLVLAIVDLFLVTDFAYVGDVCEQLEQRAFIKVPPATLLAFTSDAAFVGPLAAINFLQR